MSKLFKDIMNGFRDFAVAVGRTEDLLPLIDKHEAAIDANGKKLLAEESGEEFAFTLYCENQFGKYPVCDDWKAVNAETAVKEFTELNPDYKKIGIISAEEKLKEALVEAADSSAAEDAEVKEEPKAAVKIDLEKFKPWGKAVDTYSQIQEAGKMEDLERILEEGWPDGIKDQTLNELLVEDRDWLAEVLDMEFIDRRVK